MFGTAILIAAISVARRLVADGVHHPGGLQREQASLLDLDPRLGDPLADDALLGERLAERGALVGAPAHQLERALGDADRAHAVVDPARAEARLGDREAAALLAEQVRPRDPHVLEDDLAVALGVRRSRTPAGRGRP